MGRATKPRRYRWLLIALTPCLILAGGGGWLVASESGLKWLAGVVERRSGGSFSTKGISGSLLDAFGLQQLVLRGDGWRITLQGVQLQWQPAALLRGELKVLQLGVRHAELLSSPTGTPIVLPDSLGLPFGTNVLLLKIDSLRVFSSSEALLAGHPEGAEPDFSASDVEARFTTDDRRLALHALKATLEHGDFSGSGEIALSKPYAVKAHAALDADVPLPGRSERAHFVAEAGGDLQNTGVSFSGNGAGVSVNGTVRLAPLEDIPVSRLQVAFSGIDARRLFDGAPSAVLSGSADLHGLPGGALEGTMQVRNAHAAPLDRNGLPLLGVKSQVRLSASRWQLLQLDARLPNGGQISGVASWEAEQGKLSAQLKVHRLDPAVLDTRLTSTHLQGDIKLDGEGADQRAVVELSDGTLNIYGELERHGNRVELSGMRLSRGKTVLSGHGQLALDRRRGFRFFGQLRSLDLSEFAVIPPTDLNAGLEVSGTLLPEVAGKLQFTLSGSQFAQHDISGNGHLDFAGMQRATAALEVRLGDNRLNLNIAHGTGSDSVQLMLDAPDLARFGNGLGGQLVGRADLSGSLAEPRLKFSAQGRQLSLPGGQSIAALDATGDLASASMQLNLGLKGYRGTGTLNMPEASVELHGSRVQHSVRASASIAQGGEALGELTLKANGGLSDPAQGWQALQWNGTLDELAAQGVLPFNLTAAAPLSFSKDIFRLGTADVAVGGGLVRFSETQWTPQRWHSAGHFGGLKVRAVNMQQDKSVPDTPDFVRAFDSMRLGGKWEVTADEHLQGRFQVRRESGDWVVDGNTGLRLGLRDAQLSVRAEQDQLHARLDASGEHLGELTAQASVPLTRTDTGWTILLDAPLAGQLRLHSDDLSWLGPMLHSNLQSGGQLNFDAMLAGTIRSPRLQGEAQGDALILGLLDQGIRLEQGKLKARFESDMFYLDRLAFTVPYLPSPRDKLFAGYSLPAGAGQLSASGRIDLDGSRGDLQITAERLPLAQSTDRWIIASGTGQARYANRLLMLDGNIRADAGLISQKVSDRPILSDDVHIIGQDRVSRAGPQIAVNATLDLGDRFYLRASGLEGRLAGQLKVRKQPGESLRVTGIIAAQEAVFDAYGQRLQVERGMVNFQGTLDDPGLNILALRKGLEVEAGVEVTGTVRHPSVRLVSTPNVPDGEKLAWMVRGRVPESGDVDSALLMAAAGSIFAGQSGGQFGRALGVDEISLSQQTGADSQTTSKVTVGKRLSARARISYEQGLSKVGGVTKFTYALTPRISIVTRTGIEDALDLFYTFRFY